MGCSAGQRARRSLCAVVPAAAAIVLFGCGSGGGSSDTFFGSAERICRENEREFVKIQRTAPISAEQAEKQAQALIDVAQRALDELRDLSPPDDTTAAYQRYLKARERALGYLEDGRAAAAANDPKAYAAAKRKAAADQANRLSLARRAGLRDCSRPTVSLGTAPKKSAPQG